MTNAGYVAVTNINESVRSATKTIPRGTIVHSSISQVANDKRNDRLISNSINDGCICIYIVVHVFDIWPINLCYAYDENLRKVAVVLTTQEKAMQ